MTTAADTPAKTPWLLVFSVAMVAALDAVLRLGRLHPDEVYQHLEPALSKAFGYGILSWEWQATPGSNGPLRNWFVPGVLSLFLKATQAVGLRDVQVRRAAVELPQLLLHAAMLAAVFRLTVRRASAQAAKWAVVLVGLYPPIIWFGGRTMGESFSAAFLVWGFERLDAARESKWAPMAGGALLGFAEVTRYGSAALILPAMGWLLLTKQWRSFALAAAGGLLIAAGLGTLDKLTWGDWFLSLRQYVDFNLVSGKAEQQFGALPGWMYWTRLMLAPWAVVGIVMMAARRDTALARLFVVTGLVAGVLVGGAFWLTSAAPTFTNPSLRELFASPKMNTALGVGPWVLIGIALVVLWRRAPENDVPSTWLWVVSGAFYVAVVSATPHKETRFLYPAMVVLVVAGAPAFCAWAHRVLTTGSAPSWRPLPVLLVLSCVGFFFVENEFEPQRTAQFQLQVRASRGSTGIIIMNEGLWGAGGMFYLGDALPWCTCDWPRDGCFQGGSQDPRVNRGIYWQDRSSPARNKEATDAFVSRGFQVVEVRGDATYFERGSATQ